MTRRYQLTHRTHYVYSDFVTASYGRGHLLPRDVTGDVLPGVEQQCVDAVVAVDPPPAEQRDHVDHFGNRSTFFLVDSAHETLTVTARSTVSVHRAAPDAGWLDATSWEQAHHALDPLAAEREYLLPSPQVEPSEDVTQYAASVFTKDRPLGQALTDLMARIKTDFEYKPGTTTVRTTLPDVLRKRSGVCQDFAHLAIGALRAYGLPARYVSGYLETQPPPGQKKLLGADASHAWVSVFVPTLGWIDLDPTNDQFVDDRYVVVGWGRDYTDVPPLKGVIFTDARTSTMRVAVDLQRVG